MVEADDEGDERDERDERARQPTHAPALSPAVPIDRPSAADVAGWRDGDAAGQTRWAFGRALGRRSFMAGYAAGARQERASAERQEARQSGERRSVSKVVGR